MLVLSFYSYCYCLLLSPTCAFISTTIPSNSRRKRTFTISESKKGIDDNKNNSRNIVIIGGGIQGVSVAYHIAKSSKLPPNSNIKILEATEIAHAASGKGGGFMAKTWGDGGVTETLHRLSFELYESLAEELHCTSYRKLPVLSVAPGIRPGKRNNNGLMPDWLDGNYNRVSVLGYGDDT